MIWKSSQNRPLGRFWKGWVNILAWGAFGGKKWSRKRWFCGGMILWWVFKGIPPAQMNSMVPGTHMGRLLSPKPSLFNYFQGISSFPGKLQMSPITSLYIPCVTPDAPPWRPLCSTGTLFSFGDIRLACVLVLQHVNPQAVTLTVRTKLARWAGTWTASASRPLP